ncbi:hypothetical protein [Bacillus halotolerans]|uniref:hypothetical protein n=1 Tax=Bacillus halotolerans TaxID=260554 RepID=UPI002DBE43A0|nr:hypothetical protein [Bacillus halotolerans]MEC1600740.1 hypothetical protein [Bacillus halotolerans]
MSIIDDGLFDQDAVNMLKQMSPNFDKALGNGLLQNITMYIGGNHMNDHRSIGDVSVNGDNVNVMGDHNQFNKVTSADPQDANKAYEELLTQIEKIQDEKIRNLTKSIAKELKEAIDQKDSKKGKSLIPMIQGVIGTVGSLTTIAKFFGLTI